jgi:hypothetical protein
VQQLIPVNKWYVFFSCSFYNTPYLLFAGLYYNIEESNIRNVYPELLRELLYYR